MQRSADRILSTHVGSLPALDSSHAADVDEGAKRASKALWKRSFATEDKYELPIDT